MTEINLHAVMEDDVIKPLSTADQLSQVSWWLKHKIKRSCTKKMLLRRVPFLTWLPKYGLQDGLGDLVAGVTVGLTVIPQSLAYSNIAGLPAQVKHDRAITNSLVCTVTFSVFIKWHKVLL